MIPTEILIKNFYRHPVRQNVCNKTNNIIKSVLRSLGNLAVC